MSNENYLTKFDEVSGVLPYLDDNFKVELDNQGIYRYFSKNKEYNINKYEGFLPSLVAPDTIDKTSKKLFSTTEGIKYNRKIGYYLSTYAGYVSEGVYRENGSSGGIGTWILCELLKSGEVDYVIHVKEDKDTKDRLFKFGISSTAKEVQEGSKTKYYPTEISEVLKKVKETPGKYVIIGVPDIILAVRLLSDKDNVIKERIKYTIGLVCGHQKSAKFAECLAWQCGIKPNDLIKIDFRKKNPNSKSNQYNVLVQGLADGKVVSIEKPTNELIGQDWGQGFFKIQASDYNDDVMNETADMTIGDAWLEEYTNDSLGNNIVVVRNEKINQMINKALLDGRLNLDEISEEKIIESQRAHYRHSQDELGYRLYKLDKRNIERPEKRVKPSKNISITRRMIQNLRLKISQSSHQTFEEAVKRNDLNYFTRKMNKLSKKYKRLYMLDKIKNHGLKGTILIIFKRIFSIII